MMARGPYWSWENQGKVATVIEAPDLDTVTVRWEEGRHNSKLGTSQKNRHRNRKTYKLFSKQQGGVQHEQAGVSILG